MTDYLKTVVATPRDHVPIVFGLASFFVGIPLFVAITIVFSLGMVLVATPFTHWIPGIEYRLTDLRGTIEVGSLSVDAGSVTGVSINTLPEALAASVVGVVVCHIGLHAVTIAA